MVEDAISFWTDIQRYEDMLVADPRSYCFAPLSELYRKLGLIDDAISVAKKGCDLHPDYPAGFFTLGAAYYAKGLMPEARQALERAVSINGDNLPAEKLLGQIYVEAGEVALAEKVLQRVLQQSPDDMEATLLLRSVASTGAASQEQEELLEEADVIEELTEILDEPQLPETADISGFAEAAETAENTGFAKTAEPADLSGFAELTELASLSGFAEVGAGRPEVAPAPAAAQSPDEEFAGFEQSDDFWAIEAPEEASDRELSRAFEEPEQLEGVSEAAALEAFAAFEASSAFELSELPEVSIQPDQSDRFDLSEEFEADTFEELGSFEAIETQSAAPQPRRDPLTTATMAELYVTQGYTDKALTIYQELLFADSTNESYRLRCAELKELRARQQEAQQPARPAAHPEALAPRPEVMTPRPEAAAPQRTAAAPQLDVEAELNSWLENIRRRKDGV